MPAGVQRTVLHKPFVCTREDMRMRTDDVRSSSVGAFEEAEADVTAIRQLTKLDVRRAWVVRVLRACRDVSAQRVGGGALP